MERRFFFGALAGLGGLFTLGAAEQPKPTQARATKDTPAEYWDVHIDKGHTGILWDANNMAVNPDPNDGIIGANLVSGDVLLQRLVHNRSDGYLYTERELYVMRFPAPLRLEVLK